MSNALGRVVVALAIVAHLPFVARGDSSPPQSDSAALLGLAEHFGLFHECQPVLVAVEPLQADADAIELTEQMLHLAAESRLRAARLYAGKLDMSAPLLDLVEVMQDDPPLLIINVQVIRRTFSVRISLQKSVNDEFGMYGRADTWSSGFLGSARDAAYIQSSVSQALDQFLASYLRVNEDACE